MQQIWLTKVTILRARITIFYVMWTGTAIWRREGASGSGSSLSSPYGRARPRHMEYRPKWLGMFSRVPTGLPRGWACFDVVLPWLASPSGFCGLSSPRSPPVGWCGLISWLGMFSRVPGPHGFPRGWAFLPGSLFWGMGIRAVQAPPPQPPPTEAKL